MNQLQRKRQEVWGEENLVEGGGLRMALATINVIQRVELHIVGTDLTKNR